MSGWGPRVLIDLLIALGALVVIVGALLFNPGLTLGGRLIIMTLGSAMIFVQLAVGLWTHRGVRKLFLGT